MPRLLFTLTIHSGSNKIKRKGETPSLDTLGGAVQQVLREEFGPDVVLLPGSNFKLKVVSE